jgi:hypothetical protein
MIDRDTLISDLQKNVLRIFFQNGATVKCTLKENMLPASHKESKQKEAEKIFLQSNPDDFFAWNLDTNFWVFGKIYDVMYVEVLDVY